MGSLGNRSDVEERIVKAMAFCLDQLISQRHAPDQHRLRHGRLPLSLRLSCLPLAAPLPCLFSSPGCAGCISGTTDRRSQICSGDRHSGMCGWAGQREARTVCRVPSSARRGRAVGSMAGRCGSRATWIVVEEPAVTAPSAAVERVVGCGRRGTMAQQRRRSSGGSGRQTGRVGWVASGNRHVKKMGGSWAERAVAGHGPAEVRSSGATTTPRDVCGRGGRDGDGVPRSSGQRLSTVPRDIGQGRAVMWRVGATCWMGQRLAAAWMWET